MLQSKAMRYYWMKYMSDKPHFKLNNLNESLVGSPANLVMVRICVWILVVITFPSMITSCNVLSKYIDFGNVI